MLRGNGSAIDGAAAKNKDAMKKKILRGDGACASGFIIMKRRSDSFFLSF
jgi:hypothetical protein